jgi:hypothetical protein
MKVAALPAGSKGFDTNCRVGPAVAGLFKLHGHSFAIRYVRRTVDSGHDLNAGELATLLQAGLAVMPVQYVESENSWVPSREKGLAYGATAAKSCRDIGVPLGVCVWLDLEGVAKGTPAADVASYCIAWYNAVAGVGYVPGLYVGWRCGLNPAQLYALPFTHYWNSYNLNSDEQVAVRGPQMQQRAATMADSFIGCPDMDLDYVLADAKGGLPMAVLPC